MNEQHKLDQLLREKFNSREFDFDESYWEAAQELIENTDNQRSKGLLLLWQQLVYEMGVLMLIASSCLILAMQPEARPVDRLSANRSDQERISTHTLQHENNHFSPSQQREGSPSAAQTENVSPSSSQQKESFTDLSTSSSAYSAVISQPIPSAFSAGKGHAPEQIIHPIYPHTPTPQPVEPDQGMEFVNDADRLTEQIEKQDDFSQRKKPNLSSIKSIDYQSIDVISFIQPEQRIIPSAISQRLFMRHQLSLSLGIQASGLIPNQAEQTSHYQPTIGLAYGYQLSRRWQFVTGLRLSNQMSPDVRKSFESIRFGFGKSIETQRLEPQSLYFVSLPLQLRLQLARKHQICLGWQHNYLVQSHTDIVAETQDVFGNITASSESAWNYREGFNTWHGGLLIGYQLALSKRWALGLEAYRGLAELTTAAYWDATNTDRQQQLRLWLHWHIR